MVLCPDFWSWVSGMVTDSRGQVSKYRIGKLLTLLPGVSLVSEKVQEAPWWVFLGKSFPWVAESFSHRTEAPEWFKGCVEIHIWIEKTQGLDGTLVKDLKILMTWFCQFSLLDLQYMQPLRLGVTERQLCPAHHQPWAALPLGMLWIVSLCSWGCHSPVLSDSSYIMLSGPFGKFWR